MATQVLPYRKIFGILGRVTRPLLGKMRRAVSKQRGFEHALYALEVFQYPC